MATFCVRYTSYSKMALKLLCTTQGNLSCVESVFHNVKCMIFSGYQKSDVKGWV